jgi:hypothetical protein
MKTTEIKITKKESSLGEKPKRSMIAGSLSSGQLMTDDSIFTNPTGCLCDKLLHAGWL